MAREKEFFEVKVANDKILEKKKKFQAEREEIALRMIKYEIPKKWSPEEEESAQFKFGQACLSYDASGNECTCLLVLFIKLSLAYYLLLLICLSRQCTRWLY